MNKIIINKIIPKQPPENEDDNREYKLHLIPFKNKEKFFYEKKASQMQYRLFTGNGKALYIIGIDDNGQNNGISLEYLNMSIRNIIVISKLISANISKIRIYNGKHGKIATVRLTMEVENDAYTSE